MAQRSIANRPVTLIVTGSALTIFVAIVLAEDRWIELVYRLLTDGVLCVLWLIGALGYGGVCVRLFKISRASRLWGATIAVALGLGILSLLTLLFGSLHLAYPLTGRLLVAIGVLLAIVQLVLNRSSLALLPEKISLSSYLLFAAIPLAAMVLVSSFVPPGILWGDEPNGYDVLEYHLELPREWLQTHSTRPTTNNVFSNFPLLAESHYLLAMELKGGAWAGMYLAQLMHASFFVLAAIAIFASVREFNPPAALAASLALAGAPWIALLAPVAYNEGPLILFAALAMILAIRSISSDWPVRDLIFAGVFAGFACGTKLTAVPTVLLFIPIALVASALFTRSKLRLTGLILFVIVALVVFLPWLIRTFIATHNPVFPELTSIFGPGYFSSEQITRWHNANHLPSASLRPALARFSEFGHQVLFDPRYAFIIVPIALISIAIRFSKRDGAHPATAFLAIYLLALTIFWLFFTHLQSRFYILAIPIAALLVGQIRGKMALALVGSLIGVEIIFSTAYIGQRFSEKVIPVRGAIGAENIQSFLPKEIDDAIDPHKPLVLIGDARAFLYQVPIQNLYYRTVFDVPPVGHDRSILDAWQEGLPPAAVRVVDPEELERFSRTYFGIPPLPTDWRWPRDRMFVVR